jgi:hypothetical protein
LEFDSNCVTIDNRKSDGLLILEGMEYCCEIAFHLMVLLPKSKLYVNVKAVIPSVEELNDYLSKYENESTTWMIFIIKD